MFCFLLIFPAGIWFDLNRLCWGVASWAISSSPTRLEFVWIAADVNFDVAGATTVRQEVREDLRAARVPQVSTEAPAIWKTLKRTATISATPIRCEMKLCTIRFSTKVSHDKTFFLTRRSGVPPPPYSLCTGDVSYFQWRNSVSGTKKKKRKISESTGVPSRKKPKVHRIV